MKIHLGELSEHESTLDIGADHAWALDAAARTDEHSDKSPRGFSATFSFRKVDGLITVAGSIHTVLRLLCSRCTLAFEQATSPSFSMLYSRDPDLTRKESGRSASADADVCLLGSDELDLAEIVAEQLQLQVPCQPLCRSDCKGLCQSCGANLNEAACACDRRARAKSPFASLAGYGAAKG